jgi:RNA-directed DNA polymerase
MNRISHGKLLADFVEINLRAGVDPQITDLCAAYVRQCLKRGQKVNFYDPQPTMDQLMNDARLSTEQKIRVKQFYDRQCQLGIDDRVARICAAYAGNLVLQGAAVIFDGHHLAQKLGLPYETLLYLSSNRYQSTVGYTSTKIPKRHGGYREIDAPRSKLKTIQRWLLDHILAEVDLHTSAHGFKRGRSICTNAMPHVGKELLIKMDLKDFFPTVTFPRVLGVYLDIGYVYSVALILTRLSSYKRRLPQGAPTSPALSNLVCRKMDQRLSGLATRMDYSYTRYADDITFSTVAPNAPPDRLIRVACQIIAEEGFVFSQEKLSIRRKGSRQLVTGLIVNEKLSIPREDRKRLRAIIHNIQTQGLESQNRDNCPYFLERLEGYVAFVDGVNRQQGEKFRSEIEKIRLL